MSRKKNVPFGGHKALRRAAQHLLDQDPTSGRPVAEVAAAIGLTERQQNVLSNIFGEEVPDASASLLQQISEEASPARAFQAIDVAASLARRRDARREGRLEEPGESALPSAAKKEDELEATLTRILEAAERSGRCVGWEIDEIVWEGGGEYGVKVGIYPWGKTIIVGSSRQLVSFVNSVLDEMASERLVCPFCSAAQPLGALEGPATECACGTRMFIRHAWRMETGIVGESCWPALRETLLGSGDDREKASFAVSLIEDGAALSEVFDGAETTEAFHIVVHAVSPRARPKERDGLPTNVAIGLALEELGLRACLRRDLHYGEWVETRWWEGEIADEPVLVTLDSDGMGELMIGLDEETSRIYDPVEGISDDDDKKWSLQEAITEAWCEMDHSGDVGQWEVGNDMISRPCDLTVSACYGGDIPDHLDARWLREVLEGGVAACVAVATRFAETFAAAIRTEGDAGHI